MTEEIELTIVIPAFNEEGRLPASLDRISAYLAGRTPHLEAEVIVADDGSTDRTVAIAGEKARELHLAMKALRLTPNRGKGFAVRAGVLAARGRWILVTDADLSTPIEELEKLLGARTPVAIGSRAIDESMVKQKQPVFRRMMGKLFNRIVQRVAVEGIQDTQCGFKLFERDAARAIFQRTRIDRFAYDVEALLIARKLALEISEIPVLWFNSADTRVSLFGGIQAYADILRVRRVVARTFREETSPVLANGEGSRTG